MNLVVDLMTVKQVTLSTAGYYHLFNHALLCVVFSYWREDSSLLPKGTHIGKPLLLLLVSRKMNHQQRQKTHQIGM